MKKILLVFAHPLPRKSRINRALLKAVRDMEGVTFHDLYEVYPDFHIQVKKEQDLLLKHDVIVFQHPFYWYSTPAIIKQWEDLVLEHGFAYGVEGTALKGKLWLQVISSGGAAEAYQAEGYNRFTIRQLLAPLEQTAYLCQMPYLPPFAVQGTFQLTDEEIETHANRYRTLLEALRDETVDLDALKPYQLMPQELPMTHDQ